MDAYINYAFEQKLAQHVEVQCAGGVLFAVEDIRSVSWLYNASGWQDLVVVFKTGLLNHRDMSHHTRLKVSELECNQAVGNTELSKNLAVKKLNDLVKKKDVNELSK